MKSDASMVEEYLSGLSEERWEGATEEGGVGYLNWDVEGRVWVCRPRLHGGEALRGGWGWVPASGDLCITTDERPYSAE